MSVADWQRLGEIFQRALEQPASSRKEFVSEACGGDAEMVKAIEELLEADEEVGEFLENPLLARPPGELGGEEEPLPNDGQIGNYRLLRKIGQGGMSSVYLAVRDEDGFRRRVAIKIVRRGMESDDAFRRFRAESQILSGLDHPYIARLYDGGMVGNEVPYFAMEYVAGVPIDVYCERHRMGVKERIELFRKVCDAIHYSHRNLVVHRDIKPSNILVTPDGVPKLLDFGIAKLLNPELSAPSLESTVTWMRILTPQYASPEQVRGEMITTSSDIYSLGVLLFKLLTGDLPFQFEGKSSSDVERALTDSEPPRPSHRVKEKTGASETGTTTATAGPVDSASIEVLSRQLAGDLDDIVLKAIRAVPEHRYHSAEQLSEDLERHLAGFPVLARKGNFSYYTGRFLRRNWLAVGGSVLALVVISAFAIVTAIQSERVRLERDQALQERDEKQQVLALMEEIFKAADPTESGRKNFTVEEALNRSSLGMEARLQDQPTIEARLRHTVGTIYLNLGLPKEAESHFVRSLEIRRQLYGSKSLEVAQGLSALGAALREQGDYSEAESFAQEAVDLSRSLVGDRHPALVPALNQFVTLRCYQENYEAAEAPSLEVLSLARAELRDADPQLAAAVNNRAVVLKQRGNLAEAAEMYREALRIQRVMMDRDHPETGNLLNNLAIVFKAQGKLDEAAETHGEALALRRRIYGETHSSVAQSSANLASVLRRLGRLEGAVEAYAKAIAILEHDSGGQHPMIPRLNANVASIHVELGRPELAEEMLRQDLGRQRSATASETLLADLGSGLAAAVAAQGRYGEAESIYQESLDVLRGAYGPDHRKTQKVAEDLAALYEAWGKSSQAQRIREGL